MDIGSKASELTGIGTGGGGGGNAGTIVLVIFLILIVGALAGGLAYWIVMRKQFKLKIVVFERINGKYQPTRKDKAKKIKLGDAGDEVIKLRKSKKILPMPSLQTGINTYWYYISDDGEWINFDAGDFDEDRRQLGANFLDKEMRYARTSLQHTKEQRYNKLNWWQRNGNLVFGIAAFVIIGIIMYLIVQEYASMTAGAQKAVEISQETMKTAEKVLSSLDNLCQGGSGIQQTGG